MAQKTISYLRWLFQQPMRWVTLLVCLLAIAWAASAWLSDDRNAAAAVFITLLSVAMNTVYLMGTYQHYQMLKREFPHYLNPDKDAAA